jgi:hypothetical protein
VNGFVVVWVWSSASNDFVVCRVPLYYEAKLVFLLWLALPQTRGALKLWQDHKEKIDQLYGIALSHLEKIQAVRARAGVYLQRRRDLKRVGAALTCVVVRSKHGLQRRCSVCDVIM